MPVLKIAASAESFPTVRGACALHVSTRVYTYDHAARGLRVGHFATEASGEADEGAKRDDEEEQADGRRELLEILRTLCA